MPRSPYWIHYKRLGKQVPPMYKLLNIGRSTDAPEKEFIVYEQCDDSSTYPSGTVWIRSKEEFFGQVEVEGKMIPRFTNYDDYYAM